MQRPERWIPVGFSLAVTAVLFALALVFCDGGTGDGQGNCLEGPYACLAANGSCLLVSDNQAKVTVTWESESVVEGPVGLDSFEARSPSGEVCFQRSLDGPTILITSGGKTWRVERATDGSTTVTCPDGSSEPHAAGKFPSTAPGIDPKVFLDCRIGGLCEFDPECPAGQVCCDNQCYSGVRCPGTCGTDNDCGVGNRCCDGWCTSLPSCNVPCDVDSQCNDRMYCNGEEYCDGSRCRAAAPVKCDDGIPCTQDSCNDNLRRCDHQPDDLLCSLTQMCDSEKDCVEVVRCNQVTECDDQEPCTAEVCDQGICGYQPVSDCCHADPDCTDGVFCNGEELCTSNRCGAGALPDCNDLQECTADHCDAVKDACVHQPEDVKCDPGKICHPSQGCIDPNACVDDGKEENDTLQTAVEIFFEESNTLKICPADEDWFFFKALELSNFILVISFHAENGLIDMFLFDELGQPVGQKQSFGDGAITISLDQVGKTQNFLVQVVGVGSVSNEYVLLLNIN